MKVAVVAHAEKVVGGRAPRAAPGGGGRRARRRAAVVWGAEAKLAPAQVDRALIGHFLVKAAIDYNPAKAVGLDGALAALGRSSYGPTLRGIVGGRARRLRCVLHRGRAVPEGPTARLHQS
jgi:hypothetical protein